ncbi:MAG: amidohydrolase family protein [Velocimicrobium sp.]
MIIDFHTHIFPDAMAEKTIGEMAKKADCKAYVNGTADALLNSMEESGVEYSVILPVATKPTQFKTINTYAVALNESFQNKKGPKLISFGGIHPEARNYKEELREIVALGLAGIKLHPDYQGMMIDDIKYMRLIDYASSLGLIISVHAGMDFGSPKIVHCTVRGARRVIDEVKPEHLILAHYGGIGFWEEVEETLIGQNVYLDTAFIFSKIKQEQFLRILRNHGSEKILFGTDSPWYGQRESLEVLENWGLSEEEKNNILYKNASKLLRLK